MSTTGSLICPQCEAEYLPGISRCADCAVVLVEPASSMPRPLTDPDGLSFVTSAPSLEVARSFVAALNAASVAHYIDREQQVVNEGADAVTLEAFHVYVRPIDFKRADTLLVVAEEDLAATPIDVVAEADSREWEDPFPEIIPDSEFGDDYFDVPDLIPPPELTQKAARMRLQGILASAVATLVLVQIVAGRLSATWWVVFAVVLFEAVRRINKARALLSEWHLQNTEHDAPPR